jgi:gamma-glutamyl:cysteine ligase YbdK (ATP-grasp superfamily)
MTYKIEIDDQSGSNSQTYFDEVKQLYYRDEFSKLVQDWNNQRTQALERALTQILYPQMIKELKGKLLQEAKDHVLRVGNALTLSAPTIFSRMSAVGPRYANCTIFGGRQ